jgi:uncharacterized cupredoxin-like copper-binding protein
MTLTRRSALALAAGMGISLSGRSAFSKAKAAVIHVSLWDKGPDSIDGLGSVPPMGMAMGAADMSGATMGIKLDTETVSAGEVTFEVVNDSKETIHEVILSPVAAKDKPLPYIQETNGVDEDAAVSLGEVSELDAGKKGKLTVSLKPGTYILYCNVPGHYVMGMWTLLTVTA